MAESRRFNMTSSKHTPALTLTFIYLMLVAAALADLASARKKGCASFGHSCFGGHGKRAVEDVLPPRDYELPIPSSDNTIDEPRGNAEIEPDIVPILRQWLLSYRNRQLGSGLK